MEAADQRRWVVAARKCFEEVGRNWEQQQRGNYCHCWRRLNCRSSLSTGLSVYRKVGTGLGALPQSRMTSLAFAVFCTQKQLC